MSNTNLPCKVGYLLEMYERISFKRYTEDYLLHSGRYNEFLKVNQIRYEEWLKKKWILIAEACHLENEDTWMTSPDGPIPQKSSLSLSANNELSQQNQYIFRVGHNINTFTEKMNKLINKETIIISL